MPNCLPQARSVRHHNPERTFIVSKQSREGTLPLAVEKAKLSDGRYEIIEIEDPDNVQSVYEMVGEYMQRIKAEYDTVVDDYTSGTKAMTAALAILATLHEVDELSYITGKRVNGIVQYGTETVIAMQPYFATVEVKMKLAINFFNKSQYNAAISVLEQIKGSTGDPKITERVDPIFTLASAYAEWDRFQHLKAYELLKPLKMAELDQNKRFIGQLKTKLEKDEEPEPYLIADLINNAKRRAEDEQKYDDAVARLYRTIELIAQYKLKRKYNIDPSNVDASKLPQNLLAEWGVKNRTEKLKLALDRSYQLLETKEDEIGQRYVKDNKLRDLLQNRNTSILAHGLEPVTAQGYKDLYQKVVEYAGNAVLNLKQLMDDAQFIKLKDSGHQTSF
ncbi:MAG: TIGR02710 family CRISPR-associated CARF protein [Candidatus Bathyarchaeia archaeon]